MSHDPQSEIEKALKRPQSVSSDGTSVTNRSADDLLKLADRAAADRAIEHGGPILGVVPVIHRRRP